MQRFAERAGIYVLQPCRELLPRYGAICTLRVGAEGSAQETPIKECLIMGRELLELKAKSSSERSEPLAASRCGGERLLFAS